MSPVAAKTYTTEVICLKTIEFGEADKILQMYSPEHGRISVIAKGVKKPKSKLAGACELLNISEVQLSKGKNLDLLVQYQPKQVFSGLRTDLLKLAYGLLYSELVLQTIPDADEDSDTIYEQLLRGLQQLADAEEPAVLSQALHYQLQWLEMAGYHPVLQSCIFSEEPIDTKVLYYSFSAALGGVTTPERKRQYQQENPAHSEWVNISTTTLKLLGDLKASQGEPSQFLKAQKFVQYYFNRVFEKNLRSYKLIFDLLEPVGPLPAPKAVTIA